MESHCSDKLAYHHLFLSPNENGVTSAQPAGVDIKKQILLKNVVSLDECGKPTNWAESKLVGQYLNSHTVDILSVNDSSKTSLFTKLAKVLVEN